MHFQTLFIAAAALVASVEANFHIAGVHQQFWFDTPTPDIYRLAACPANKMNCDCVAKGQGLVTVPSWEVDDDNLPNKPFGVPAGFCGQGKLNFYPRGGGRWEVYRDGGDGTRVAECFAKNGVQHSCTVPFSSLRATSRLECYSSICG
jgi:hypothetical protein